MTMGLLLATSLLMVRLVITTSTEIASADTYYKIVIKAINYYS
jgi:hypothetical protein